jgi:L-iditol 2-dehydrogenase
MLVAMYYGQNDMRIEEMPVPEIGPGELLVRTAASGICGSDVMHWYRAGKTPLVLGHEIAGEITKVGEGIDAFAVGDRISASHHVPCNTCHYCLNGHHTVCDTLRSTHFFPGGFSEYVRLPAINVDRGVYRLPDELSFDKATFIEPLACVYRGQRIVRTGLGKSVFVLGSGISGILHIQLARALDASPVMATDINPYRRAAAERFGADAVFDAKENIPESVKNINNGRLADIVILTTGAKEAVQQALRSVERGGTVLLFAPVDGHATVQIPINDLFWRNEVTVTSSYAANYKEHMAALKLIEMEKINVSDMITHRFSLTDIDRGFKLVESARDSLKVIIEPQEKVSSRQ